MKDDVLLQASHLTVKLKIDSKEYPVVNDLSFELKRGRTLALVGESGCGKSMTALAILGLLPHPPALPPTGTVLYRGQNLLTLKEKELRPIRGRRIAMIFQDPMSSLNPVYTIGDQLMEVAQEHLGEGSEQARTTVCKAMNDAQLPDPLQIMRLYPHQLSGGMLQRAMIAMALICSPDILIADEPTTALDVTIQAQILQLLKELEQKKGMATLLITHDMGVVAQNGDDVLVMYAGSHVEQGSVYSLFDTPSHPYTQALFGLRLKPHLRKKKLPAIAGAVSPQSSLSPGCPFAPRCRCALKECSEEPISFYNLKDRGHSARCLLFRGGSL